MDSSLYANPSLYDAQYATLARDGVFYAARARKVDGPVLELAAGTGRISEAILETGASLVGIERSRPMIAIARRRLACFGGRGRLVQADFRRFALGRTFALAVCGFNSLSHAAPAEFAAALARIRVHVKEGGAFVFDLPNPVPRNPGPFLRERFFDERVGEACEVWETLEAERDPRLWERVWEYRWASGRRARETMRRWEYSEREVRAALAAAGFRVDALTGDFTGGAFGAVALRQVWKVSPVGAAVNPGIGHAIAREAA